MTASRFLALSLATALGFGTRPAAAATLLARTAVERTIRAHAAIGGREVSIGDAKALELSETLSHHGVVSDVEVHDVTPLEDGKPVSGIGRLFVPRRTVAVAEGADGELALLADRKGAKTPNLSSHPTGQYAWKNVRQSPLAKVALLADGVSYTAFATTALFAPHLLATIAVADAVESVIEKAAYGVAILGAQPKIRAQHAAVGEVASFVKAESAAGRNTSFSELYARYQKNIEGQPSVKPSARLDAFQLRDWLSRALVQP